MPNGLNLPAPLPEYPQATPGKTAGRARAAAASAAAFEIGSCHASPAIRPASGHRASLRSHPPDAARMPARAAARARARAADRLDQGATGLRWGAQVEPLFAVRLDLVVLSAYRH